MTPSRAAARAQSRPRRPQARPVGLLRPAGRLQAAAGASEDLPSGVQRDRTAGGAPADRQGALAPAQPPAGQLLRRRAAGRARVDC
eukprot:6126719-Pyramimonas_sp.AAC.1